MHTRAPHPLHDHEHDVDLPFEPPSLATKVSFSMMRAMTLLADDLDRAMHAEKGINFSDVLVLVQIALAGGRLKMAEIADTVVVTRGGVTKLVDRLVARGYLERVPSPDDRRVIYAELSEAGRQALREVQPVLEQVMEQRIGSALSDDQLNALHLAAHELCLNNSGWGMPESIPDEVDAAVAP